MAAFHYMIRYSLPEVREGEIRTYTLWAESPSEAKMKFLHIFNGVEIRIVSVTEIA